VSNSIQQFQFDLEITNETVSDLQRQLEAANIIPTYGEGEDSAALEALRTSLMTTEVRITNVHKHVYVLAYGIHTYRSFVNLYNLRLKMKILKRLYRFKKTGLL
jgi:hypothetical protein